MKKKKKNFHNYLQAIHLLHTVLISVPLSNRTEQNGIKKIKQQQQQKKDINNKQTNKEQKHQQKNIQTNQQTNEKEEQETKKERTKKEEEFLISHTFLRIINDLRLKQIKRKYD